MSLHRKIRYSLEKFTDCHDGEHKIAAFTMRTTDGEDEGYVAKRAESKGTSMAEELVRYSIFSYEIVKPDGVKTIVISHPFETFDKWSTKARNLVLSAWKKLATPDEADLADFFKSASETE